MLNWGQAIFLAILQGVSELFPVSSLGHTVILPAILGWQGVEKQPTYVPFVVMLHIGTAFALVWFYRDRWVGVVEAFVISAVRGKLQHTPQEHLAWLLFFGTIPAGVIGAVLEHPLKQLFSTPLVAGIFLIVNGAIMLLTERLREQQTHSKRDLNIEGTSLLRRLADLNWRDAVKVGGAQAFALLPGISRSGVTICAGLLSKLDHEDAANYAFMLATPIILAAGLLETPTLIEAGGVTLLKAVAGGIIAAVTAYLSVRFLTRYFRVGRLHPFAYYCVVIGLIGIIFAVVRGG
ncbi:MAG: undecaprenyl-diphosphate phosphatase [Chloroflexi bacterium]|nr:undecaprenyl-diphosphate phosphatase [Chloroflexota bacterium]